MIASFIRKLRYGQPIVVVSGLPRSGTSMMMRMLVAGGVEVLADGVRRADVDNPNGYFEYEPVKGLDKDGDRAWLRQARGKAVKIISQLLTWLPEEHDYRVIFMRRDLDEVLASQRAMLEHRGEGVGETRDDAATRELYTAHLRQVERFLNSRKCFRTLPMQYRDVIADPASAAARVAAFVEQPLDQAEMARAVDATLYRNRA